MVFLVWKGLVHHEFVPRSQTENKEYYRVVLRHLSKAVCKKRADLWKEQTGVLQHDNVPAHASLLVINYLVKNNTTVLPHPSYSPDLAPPDFFLFLKLKATLIGLCFETMKEIKKNSEEQLSVITTVSYTHLDVYKRQILD